MFSICSGGPCSNKAHPPTLHGSMFTNALMVFNCTILMQHLEKTHGMCSYWVGHRYRLLDIIYKLKSLVPGWRKKLVTANLLKLGFQKYLIVLRRIVHITSCHSSQGLGS